MNSRNNKNKYTKKMTNYIKDDVYYFDGEIVYRISGEIPDDYYIADEKVKRKYGDNQRGNIWSSNIH